MGLAEARAFQLFSFDFLFEVLSDAHRFEFCDPLELFAHSVLGVGYLIDFSVFVLYNLYI